MQFSIKITKNIILFYTSVVILLLILLNVYQVGSFEENVQYTEFAVNFVDIASSIIIYYTISKQNKGFIILPLSIILLFLMDIEYLVAFYFKDKYSFVIYFIITYLWYTLTVLGLILILVKFVYAKREGYILFTSFFIIASVIIFYFSPNRCCRYR